MFLSLKAKNRIVEFLNYTGKNCFRGRIIAGYNEIMGEEKEFLSHEFKLNFRANENHKTEC